MGFRAVEAKLYGNQARNLLAMAGDGDLFAALHPIEQLTKFVLRLEGADLAHVFLTANLNYPTTNELVCPSMANNIPDRSGLRPGCPKPVLWCSVRRFVSTSHDQMILISSFEFFNSV